MSKINALLTYLETPPTFFFCRVAFFLWFLFLSFFFYGFIRRFREITLEL